MVSIRTVDVSGQATIKSGETIQAVRLLIHPGRDSAICGDNGLCYPAGDLALVSPCSFGPAEKSGSGEAIPLR